MIQAAVVASAVAVRTGLRALLVEDPDIEVHAEATTVAQLGPFLDEIDILILTAEAASRPELEQLLVETESLAVLLLVETEHNAVRIFSGLDLRAWGVLPLDCTAEELLSATKAMVQGLLVGAPALLEPLFVQFTEVGEGFAEPLVEALTERESEVLQLLAQGLANKQIAVKLGISEHTVKFHISGIYTKLGVTNRTEAIRQGVRQGLVIL